VTWPTALLFADRYGVLTGVFMADACFTFEADFPFDLVALLIYRTNFILFIKIVLTFH